MKSGFQIDHIVQIYHNCVVQYKKSWKQRSFVMILTLKNTFFEMLFVCHLKTIKKLLDTDCKKYLADLASCSQLVFWDVLTSAAVLPNSFGKTTLRSSFDVVFIQNKKMCFVIFCHVLLPCAINYSTGAILCVSVCLCISHMLWILAATIAWNYSPFFQCNLLKTSFQLNRWYCLTRDKPELLAIIFYFCVLILSGKSFSVNCNSPKACHVFQTKARKILYEMKCAAVVISKIKICFETLRNGHEANWNCISVQNSFSLTNFSDIGVASHLWRPFILHQAVHTHTHTHTQHRGKQFSIGQIIFWSWVTVVVVVVIFLFFHLLLIPSAESFFLFCVHAALLRSRRRLYYSLTFSPYSVSVRCDKCFQVLKLLLSCSIDLVIYMYFDVPLALSSNLNICVASALRTSVFKRNFLAVSFIKSIYLFVLFFYGEFLDLHFNFLLWLTPTTNNLSLCFLYMYRNENQRAMDLVYSKHSCLIHMQAINSFSSV